MNINIGNPPLQPDGVNLDINTSSGKLELKAGTQGDILYFNGTAWANLGIGTNGFLLKAGGAGTNPAWANVPSGEWTLLTTLSPSGVSTITASSLAAYAAYKVVVLNTISGNAAEDWLALRFNGDTGANYQYKYISGTTVTSTTGATSLLFAESTNNLRTYAEALIAGISGGYCNVNTYPSFPQGGVGTPRTFLGGNWAVANSTQINSITVMSGQTFTGTIYVYGRN